MATLYGSVNSQANGVTTLYGSDNSQAVLINKLYGAASPRTSTIGAWQGNQTAWFSPNLQFNLYIAQTIRTSNSFRVIGKIGLTYPDHGSSQYAYMGYDLDAEVNGQTFQIYQANTQVYGDGGDGTSSAATTDFDVTISLPSGVSTYSLDVKVVRPVITSYQDTLSWTLDSSEAGAKLIHQGFGHVDYGYGYVEYYTDSSNTTTGIVVLESQSDVNKLGGSGDNWSATIGGVTIYANNIRNVVLTNKVASLPENFLHSCGYIDSVDISRTLVTTLPRRAFSSTVLQGIGRLPNTLTTIGDDVLYISNWFSQTLVLPPNLTSIGTRFLANLRYSSPTINVGNLPATVIAESNSTFSAYSNSSVAYTQGVKIAGANRAAWMTRFPNRTSGPYRNLVDAGY